MTGVSNVPLADPTIPYAIRPMENAIPTHRRIPVDHDIALMMNLVPDVKRILGYLDSQTPTGIVLATVYPKKSQIMQWRTMTVIEPVLAFTQQLLPVPYLDARFVDEVCIPSIATVSRYV